MATIAELRNRKRSVSFDQSINAYINAGNIDLGSPVMTVEHWLKNPDNVATERLCYCKEDVIEARIANGFYAIAWSPFWSWHGAVPIPVNEWTHIAVVYDGTRHLIYRNGELMYQRNQTGAVLNNVNPFKIGARGVSGTAGSTPFKGNIRDFRIWKSARTQAEIRHSMHGIGGKEVGLFAWWPLTDEAGTQSIDLGPSGFVGTNGTGVTRVDDVGNADLLLLGEASQGYHLEKFAQDIIGTTPSKWRIDVGSPVVATVGDNLNKVLQFPGDGAYHRIRSKWKMNVTPGEVIKGTIRFKTQSGALLYFGLVYNTGTYNYFYSTSGNIPWATVTGQLTVPAGVTSAQLWAFNYSGNTGPMWVEEFFVEHNDGIFEMFSDGNMDFEDFSEMPDSLQFDGTTRIDINNPLVQANLSQEFTVEATLKMSSTQPQGTVPLVEGLNHGLNLCQGTSNKLLLYLNGGVDDYYDYGNFNLKDNQWHHVVFVFKNMTGLKEIYVDGIDVSQNGPNNSSIPVGNTSKFTIGRGFIGQMKEFRIWNIARTAQEIRENKTRFYKGNEANLVCLLRMDEGVGGVAENMVSLANNGIITGGVAWEYSFDGQTSLSNGRMNIKGELIEGVEL